MATRYVLSYRPAERRWRKRYQGKYFNFPLLEGETKESSYQRVKREWLKAKAEFDIAKAGSDEAEVRKSWAPALAEVRRVQRDLIDSYGDTEQTREIYKTIERLFVEQIISPAIKHSEYATGPEIEFVVDDVRQKADSLHWIHWQPTPSPDGNLRRENKQPPAGEPPWEEVPSDDQSNEIRETAGQFIDSLSGKASLKRVANVKQEVGRFLSWLPSDATIVFSMRSKTLASYLHFIESQPVAAKTKSDRIAAVKQFALWAYKLELIESIPRLIAVGDFKVNVGTAAISVFEDSEIEAILKSAKDRERLYILLALNCGCTQIDIADLKRSEVDFEKGTIRRKRSKTREHENVPVVEYRLWPETLSLLQENAGDTSERVLVNVNGNPLVDVRESEGKANRTDAIAKAMQRLRNRMERTSPIAFKKFRKTAASKLGSNDRFARWASYFLGHAPASTADRHYVRPDQHSFDEAICWLRGQFIREEGMKAEP